MITSPCELNNEAASLMQQARYNDAISTLTKALRVVKVIMSGSAQFSPTQPLHSGVEQRSCCKLAGGRSFCHGATIGTTTPSYIFCDPIRVVGEISYNDLQKCELVAFAVLYNLALAYQLEGVGRFLGGKQETATAFLRRASSLYERSHEIIKNHKVQVPLVHSMAIYSNLGYLHRIVGEEEKSERYLNYLLSTILYVVDCGGADDRSSLLLDSFFSNVMPLISNSSSAPAA